MRKITFILIVLSTFLSPPLVAAHHSRQPIKAVLFDVFGTVVDWRGTMVEAFERIFKEKKINVAPPAFVKDWVHAYANNMEKISKDPSKFQTVDALNNNSLTDTLRKHHIFNQFSAAERTDICLLWHRLNPWPDSVKGISALKENFIIGTLTNGNIKLMVDLSKHAHLPWDVIFSGEFIKRYKPDARVYQSAAQFLNLPPEQILLVASHKFDLEAAKKIGFKTAYVFRPKEFEIITDDQLSKQREFDYNVNSIEVLAQLLAPQYQR